MNLEDLLQGPMKNILVDQLTSTLGVNEPAKTSSAVDSTISVLLNAVAKNVAKPEGANAFINALNRDHDGSVVDNLTDFLGGQFQPENSSMTNGAGILKHLLGGKQESAAQTIGQQSGMDAGTVMKLMSTLAPILMGVLGKANQQSAGQPSGGGLIDMVLNSTKKVNQQTNQGGLLTQIFDKDGDGSIMDDVAGMGFKALLGRLFKR
ncbi:MAG: DUF937 domain-containing protein [Saprospiraceae bacterium]